MTPRQNDADPTDKRPAPSGRSRAAEALIDRSSGLVILHGLPGSGRSGLVRWWLRSRELSDAEYVWVDASRTTPDEFIADVQRPDHQVVVIEQIAPSCSDAWQRVVLTLINAGVQVIVLAGQDGTFHAPVIDRTVIGPLDLAWSTADLAGYLAGRDLQMSTALAAELLRKTGGWALPIIAAADAYRAGSVVNDLDVGLHSASTVVAEHLTSISSDDVFWRAMSMDLQLSPDMLEAMCGEPIADRIRQAVHSGIARIESGPGSTAITLIPLLRDRVYQESTRRDPDSVRELHRRLSAWLEQNDQPVRALLHATSGDDTQATARIVDHYWPEILAAQGVGGLKEPLAGLVATETKPSAGFHHLTELFGIRPLGPVQLTVPRSVSALARATDDDSGVHLLRTAAAAMMANRSRGRIDVAVRLAEAFDPLAEACLNSPGSRSGFVPFWYLQTGITHALNYDLPRALMGLERAWACRDNDNLGFVARAVSLRIALLRCVQGLPREAENWLARGLAEPSSCPALKRYVDTPIAVVRHARAVDTLDLLTAEAIHISQLESPEHDELWPLRVWSQFRWLVNVGEVSRALITIEDAVAIGGPQDGLRRAMPLTLKAHLMLFVDQAESAVQLVASSDMHAYDLLVDSRIKLLAGSFDEALMIADQGVALTQLFPRMSVSFEATGIAAAAALGDHPAVRTRLQSLIETATKGDILIVLAELPRQVLEAHADLAGLSEIIQRLDAAGVGPSSWPQPVALVRLTERERVILQAMHELPTSQAIARHLTVSINTVKTQQRTLYRKLGASNRDEALAKSDQLGLLK